MNLRGLLVFSLVLGSAAAWQAGAQEKRQKSFEEIVGAPVVLKLPGMGEARLRSNLRYSAADPHLFMDVYSPLNLKRGEKAPVVMFIHGGAGSDSRAKDWGIYQSWGRLAAASGFTGVTFNHRLGFPAPLLAESAADLAAAIEFVRANAAAWNADPERICLAAYSAGGPLLSLGFDRQRPYVKCLVAFYAFLDVQQSELHRTHEPAERVKAFSLIEHLGDEHVRAMPFFIARAGLDEIPTMNDSIDRFIGRAIEKNANVVVWNHPTGVHTFDNQNDDDRSREIIGAALEFMKRHLR
jgi:acetyl esterase/lipase